MTGEHLEQCYQSSPAKLCATSNRVETKRLLPLHRSIHLKRLTNTQRCTTELVKGLRLKGYADYDLPVTHIPGFYLLFAKL